MDTSVPRANLHTRYVCIHTTVPTVATGHLRNGGGATVIATAPRREREAAKPRNRGALGDALLRKEDVCRYREAFVETMRSRGQGGLGGLLLCEGGYGVIVGRAVRRDAKHGVGVIARPYAYMLYGFCMR